MLPQLTKIFCHFSIRYTENGLFSNLYGRFSVDIVGNPAYIVISNERTNNISFIKNWRQPVDYKER